MILVDAHPRRDWLRVAVEKRLREELAELQVEINEEEIQIVASGYGVTLLPKSRSTSRCETSETPALRRAAATTQSRVGLASDLDPKGRFLGARSEYGRDGAP